MADQKPGVDKNGKLLDEILAIQQPMERRRTRPLGLLETMYHTLNCMNVDVCPAYFRVSCKHPISRQQIKLALHRLMEQFAALRLTITQTGQHSFKFVEKKHVPVVIHEMQIETQTPTLSRECSYRFDFSRGPLWKFTWLRTPNDSSKCLETSNTFQFVFIFHHAIADLKLIRVFVKSFLQNILYFQGALSESSTKHLHIHPCVENCIPLHLVGDAQMNSYKNCPMDAINMYNASFHSEINFLSNKDSSTEIRLITFSEEETIAFFQQCRKHNVKVTSALTAATSLSFLQLIRKAIPTNHKQLTIPFETMVDLRRYILEDSIKDVFGSVGAVHMPLQVEVDLSKNINSKSHYWSVAEQCQKRLDYKLAKGEPMRVLRTEVPLDIQNPPMKGKSPYVLTLTSLGCLDDVVPVRYNDVMKLEEFVPWSNVNIDDMPIFYIGAYALNNKLTLAVGYCSGYTSHQTTGEFAWHVTNFIKSCSKL